MSERAPDDLLIERAVQGDRASFTALYEHYVERVYRHVYYRVPEQVEAEDITQEVFMRAWKAIGKYRKTGAPFAAWLITIAGNLITDYYKHRKRVVVAEGDGGAPGEAIPDPARVAEASFNREMVRKAVHRLKGDKQKVIMMHFIDGFSYEEIARTLKKSEGAIRVIQYRALIDLKKMLAQE